MESYNSYFNTYAQGEIINEKLHVEKSQKCVVVIPVYKQKLSQFEKDNLSNTVNRLKDSYDICIIGPSSINVSRLSKEFNYKFQYKKYNNSTFKSKESYSLLLESADFYETFNNWEYMLLVQLDVWIFGTAENLEKFLTYDFAYIGAPWSRNYIMKAFGVDDEFCGNGGFSLRNTSMMIDILSNSDVNATKYVTVEDQYISYIIYNDKKYDTCLVDIALQFSIDNEPEYWHKRLGNMKYPFGVHMGKKEFKDYWSSYIERSKLEYEKHLSVQIIPIVVSLTSFKDRLINDAPKIITNMLDEQILKPNLVSLCIYKDDLDNIKRIQSKLRKYIDSGKLEIIVAEDNLRPHLKYYYTMKKHKDAIIITVDDDEIYSNELIRKLYNTYLEYPNCVSANRIHKMTYDINGYALDYNKWEYEYDYNSFPSFDNFATGVGGVLYPPDILKIDTLSLDEIKEYITTDDIYLKLIENRKNILVVGTNDIRLQKLKYINTESAKTFRLCDVNTKNEMINDVNIKKSGLYRKLNDFKLICYTVISGPYDKLIEPKVVTEGWEYICFTDQTNFKSNVWKILPIPDEIMNDNTLSQVKKQRIIKIQPYLFLDYDYCLYVDANITIKTNLNLFFEKHFNDSIVITKHPDRDCIYDEAKAILKLKKDTSDSLDRQVSVYINEDFPKHYGLHETNVILRKNEPEVNKIMSEWADILKEYSHRDQMSLDYVLWKNEYHITTIPISERNTFFLCSPHRRNNK